MVSFNSFPSAYLLGGMEEWNKAITSLMSTKGIRLVFVKTNTFRRSQHLKIRR